MNNTDKTLKIALIPAFKPGAELPALAAEISGLGFRVVAVDDGSGEQYSAIFADTSRYAKILVHPENLGKGAAIKTGLAYILSNFHTPYVVVTADADGQHKPEDINKVCNEAIAERGAMILGSRHFGKDVPTRSRFGNALTRSVFNVSTGRHIYDTQTGLRAFTDDLVTRLIDISGDRYEYEMNVLMELSREGTPIREVAIETVYIDNNSGSHFDTVRDSARIFREILRFSASSLISFLVDYILYCIFGCFLGIAAANISARIISAAVNYTLNRKMVFKSTEPVRKSAVGYFILAGCILLCNTAMLSGLTALGADKYISKIAVEIALFAVSYLVQHSVIFGKFGKVFGKGDNV